VRDRRLIHRRDRKWAYFNGLLEDSNGNAVGFARVR
jgi:hypothetical protein